MISVEGCRSYTDLKSTLSYFRTPPPKLPDRNKSMSEKPPRVPPKSANIASEQERQKNKNSQNKSKTTENNANNFLQPCLNVNQRRVVKYNLLLSMTINVLVMALGGTGFFSIVSGSHQEEDSYKYGKQDLQSLREIRKCLIIVKSGTQGIPVVIMIKHLQ